tara:strand:+ start:2456 stop:2629 length:174 start_codon:yes stop_codon:yes gene_type:complete
MIPKNIKEASFLFVIIFGAVAIGRLEEHHHQQEIEFQKRLERYHDREKNKQNENDEN